MKKKQPKVKRDLDKFTKNFVNDVVLELLSEEYSQAGLDACGFKNSYENWNYIVTKMAKILGNK